MRPSPFMSCYTILPTSPFYLRTYRLSLEIRATFKSTVFYINENGLKRTVIVRGTLKIWGIVSNKLKATVSTFVGTRQVRYLNIGNSRQVFIKHLMSVKRYRRIRTQTLYSYIIEK